MVLSPRSAKGRRTVIAHLALHRSADVQAPGTTVSRRGRVSTTTRSHRAVRAMSRARHGDSVRQRDRRPPRRRPAAPHGSPNEGPALTDASTAERSTWRTSFTAMNEPPQFVHDLAEVVTRTDVGVTRTAQRRQGCHLRLGACPDRRMQHPAVNTEQRSRPARSPCGNGVFTSAAPSGYASALSAGSALTHPRDLVGKPALAIVLITHLD